MSESAQAGEVKSAAAQKATRIRYLIVFCATLMSFLLYLDRFCVSFAIDYIRQDLGMTQGDAKWFLSAFFWSYALAQVPAGWLSDRYGARIMLVIYILTWSLFTGLIGAASSFFILIVTRLGCGLGQAGAYPTAASIVGRWMPVSARGTASGTVATGGRIGGAVAPVLTAYLIVLFVPLGTPVELTSKDVLIPSELIERLQEDGKGSSLRSQLTSEQLTLLDAATSTTKGEVDDKERIFSGVEADELTAMLNRMIKAADIYNEKQMGAVKLPNEALDMLARVNDGETLTDPERTRFHRFLVEGVFPRGVAKLYGKGWRPIMYIYGFAGIFVAAFFWFFFYNRPEAHPWSNSAEHALILKGREHLAKEQKLKPAPVAALMKSLNMWYNCFSQWGTNVGWVFLVTWLPRYLMDVHNVPILERGTMAMTPILVGMVGMMCGGKVTDLMASKFGIKWGRRIPIAGSRLTALLAYLGCVGITTLAPESSLNTPWVFVGLFSMVAFSTDFGTPSSWAFSQDIGGRQVGSVLGWGNMWGNLGAAVSPLIYDFFLGENPSLYEWNLMFTVCAGGFLFSGICGLLMDATKPIEGVED
ncbi:MAG: MFS transporter [Planctomycetota bacterium]|nr:MFS transporter [Planctomycetota bacterium]MDA1251537.1 MFS transporter [Planctomycetota bacterium]